MRICLVKTSSMGDVIHALPALTDAQKAFPDLQVDWVVEENFAEIPTWHSAVNQVIPIAIRRWRKQLWQGKTWQEWRAYCQLLQQNQYDAVIDAQGLVKSALFAARLAKGEKYGYDKHCAREPLAAWFYDHRFSIDYHQHAVERIRQLFALSLGYPVPQTQGDYGIAHHFSQSFSRQKISPPYLVFIHATTRADKHWRNEEWKKLARETTALGFAVHLPWGNKKEKQSAEWIAQGIENAVVLPKLSLTELAQHIANAQAVVSVDTGLAHLTAALDKPNITLYGATNPDLIGTYGKNQFHLQGTTMAQISAEAVLQRLRTLL
ncbi:lipopolysaccharide heptosyltransferase RfaC [Avibacterium paragallinarum]|uniref:lipopolysaccharide heptosyltransferase RfaC n=1 Tax=Avibacterium paragallinarum TaxID=728 RepID=UPI0021F6B667|nr:lipopolysaccharide heptosyltransferase RfaC [Avibacterium paragallinarum]UXN36868.1 lipopolysaccharide heptosyltransferase RfaC [Avibacterium paragallinarum]